MKNILNGWRPHLSNNITLPKVNEIIPAKSVNPRLLLVYSEPKAGKTELFMSLPNSLLLDLEDGSAFAAGTKIDIVKLTKTIDNPKNYTGKMLNLFVLDSIGKQILKDGQPYKYIIVDTASELEDWCETDATIMYKNSVIGKNFKENSVLNLPNGGGYHWLRQSYGRWFNFLRTLPTECLIVLAHVKDKMIVDKQGREVAASDLDLTGKLRSITCAKADAIGYLYRKSNAEIVDGKVQEDIWISFRNSDVNTGNRPKHLINDILLSKVVDPRITPIVADWDKIFLPTKE